MQSAIKRASWARAYRFAKSPTVCRAKGGIDGCSVSVLAWNPDAVGAGLWHAVNGLCSLAYPGVHSTHEVALIASKGFSTLEYILELESEATLWNGGSLDLSYKVLGEVVSNFFADVDWAI